VYTCMQALTRRDWIQTLDDWAQTREANGHSLDCSCFRVSVVVTRRYLKLPSDHKPNLPIRLSILLVSKLITMFVELRIVQMLVAYTKGQPW